MQKTGTVCRETGTYESDCPCRVRITIHERQIFPGCGACQRSVTWTLIGKERGEMNGH